MTGKHPWMPWYAADWLNDRDVMAMHRIARSMYFDLLNHEWIGGPLPDDVAEIARILGEDKRSVAPHWPTIRARFVVDSSSKLVHIKLESMKNRARIKSEKASNSAKSRHEAHANALLELSCDRDASQSQSQSHKEKEESSATESRPPLPFSVNEAIGFIAKGGRFRASKANKGQSINAQRLIREYPDSAVWKLVGAWLGAGGEGWRQTVDVRALGDFPQWVEHAKAWNADGRKPIGKTSQRPFALVEQARPKPPPFKKPIAAGGDS
jgi:hypothetical protein